MPNHLPFCFVILSFVATLSASKNFAEEREKKFPDVPKIPVVAHRGFSYTTPENTLPAIVAAAAVGAHGSECDLHQTSDGVIYLLHDKDLKRTGGVDIAAEKISFADLRRLDAGLWKGEAFRGTMFPTAEEMLATHQETAIHPVIEVKAGGFEEKLVHLLRETPIEKTAVIIDFDAARVKKFRALAPEICVAWLVSFEETVSTDVMVETILKTLAECNTNVVDLQFKNISPELLARLGDAGIHVWCWTVDKPEDLRRMVEWGVESITTNRPDLALEVIVEVMSDRK